MLISKKMFKLRDHKAAIIMQKHWRGCKTREWVKVRRAEMVAAASRIQSAWRLYWFLQIGPRIRKARFGNAAIMVQKWMKGYLAKKHAYKSLMNVKVNVCYDHFMQIKKEREANARLMIRYHVKKYFIKVKTKKAAEKARKAAIAAKKAEDLAKQRKKYGYGGPPKKKKPKPKPATQKTLDSTALKNMQTTVTADGDADTKDGGDDEDDKSDGGEPDRDMGLEDNQDINTEPGGEDLNDRLGEDGMEDGEKAEGGDAADQAGETMGDGTAMNI